LQDIALLAEFFGVFRPERLNTDMLLVAKDIRFLATTLENLMPRKPQVVPERVRSILAQPKDALQRIMSYVRGYISSMASPLGVRRGGMSRVDAMTCRSLCIALLLCPSVGGPRSMTAIARLQLPETVCMDKSCKIRACTGNSIQANIEDGTCHVCYPHHKNQLAGRTQVSLVIYIYLYI
jgi:hypothetical protein